MPVRKHIAPAGAGGAERRPYLGSYETKVLLLVSVCNGEYGVLMEQCVASARRAGVFKEFHVWRTQHRGCETCDAFKFRPAQRGCFKAGLSQGGG